MTDVQIYIRFKGRTLGPFSLERASEMKRRGQITRLHELSTDGMSWVKAVDVELLFPPELVQETSPQQPSLDSFSQSNSPLQDPFSQPSFNPAAITDVTQEEPVVDRKGQAIASLIIGLTSLSFGCCLPLPIAGIVLSLGGMQSSSRGLAIAGLILSIIATLGWIAFYLLVLLGVITVPLIIEYQGAL